MQIEKIGAQNFLGLAHVDIDLRGHKIHLFAGSNGAGKSSIRNAIEFAFDLAPARVKLKKEYGLMVKEGAKKGRVAIQTSGGVFERDVASGKLEVTGSPEIPKYTEYALDIHLFASLKLEERRALLYALMNVDASADKLATLLIARKVQPDTLAAFDLKYGPEHALKAVEKKLTETRAEWKAITGETYGSEKAATWAAPQVAFDANHLARLEVEVEDYDRQLGDAQRNLGSLQAGSQQQERLRRQRDELADTAGQAAKRQQLLDMAKKELSDFKPQVVDLEDRIIRAESAGSLNCPCCGVVLALVDGQLVEASGLAAEDVGALKAKLAQYQNSQSMLERAVQNRQRDLNDSLAAQQTLDTMKDLVSQDNSAAIEAAQAKVDELKEMRDAAMVAKVTYSGYRDGAKRAADATDKALKLHHAIQQYELLRELLGPDGIPGEMLTKALKPLNDRLAAAASVNGWETVKLEADMQVTQAGRDYRLLSESEQWRADAQVSEAIAHFAGLKFLVLDRMDMLVPQNRPGLFQWLQAIQGSYESILIMASAKQRPQLPPMVKVWWIENGELATNPQAVAA